MQTHVKSFIRSVVVNAIMWSLILWSFFEFILWLFLGGVRTLRYGWIILSAELKFPNLSEDEILSIVEPIMDSCLEGSNEGDHKKHTKYFTNRMKSIVTPEELKRQLSIEPKVFWTKREFVCLCRRSDSVGIVWKQKTSSSNDELINQAIFKEVEGKILIDHCMICWFFMNKKEIEFYLKFHKGFRKYYTLNSALKSKSLLWNNFKQWFALRQKSQKKSVK